MRNALYLTIGQNELMLKRLIVAALLLSAPAALASGLDDVVAKVMKAYGGAAAWEKVTVLRERGRVEAMGRTGKMTREWTSPDSLRVEIVYPDRTEVRDVHGATGTRNGADVTGMGLDAMRLQETRLALPLILVKKQKALRDLGTHDGLRVVELPLEGTMALTVSIDPATWHIVRSESRTTGVTFQTDYSDFRQSGGLLIAFKEHNSAQGMPTGDNVIESVEINPH
jgi:hypothetical protein